MAEGADLEDQILQNVLATETSLPTTQEDWIQYLGQIYFLVKDPETFLLLYEDPDMKPLMPTLSHLLRTSYLDKKTITIMKLRWRRAVRLQLLCLKEPSLVNQAKYDSWLNFGFAAIEDAREGWRGRLVTERIKVHKVETSAKKRGRFLGMFG